MGSRTNFELKDSAGSVWLYSHWNGESKANDVANALLKAEARWSDPSYAMRIVASQLIGKDWDSETGYGLSSYQVGEESYDPICIDFENQTVTYHHETVSFEKFIDAFF